MTRRLQEDGKDVRAEHQLSGEQNPPCAEEDAEPLVCGDVVLALPIVTDQRAVASIAATRRQNAATQSNVLSPLPLPVITSGRVTPKTCSAVQEITFLNGGSVSISGISQSPGITMIVPSICVKTT
jgi:hypothetical protein